jgi:hypothetical protein
MPICRKDVIPPRRWRDRGIDVSEKEKVLEAMKKAGKPVNVGDVVKISGMEKSIVEKAFKDLKADGSIVSPVRCKWEPAKK